ncbi:hypothetical protein AJ87_05465 [Rhizobium yanglingense]|nr:hypothetical protein AJ87_05465 [Rhizobium yanglingense]
MNLGTIVESPMLNIRMVKRGETGKIGRGGGTLGKVEEYFLEQLSAGDTFIFSGKVLRFEGIRENEALVSQAFSFDPKIPSYAAASFRFRPILPTRCDRCSPIPTVGTVCRIRSATGCRCRRTSRCSRSATNC